MSNRTEVKPEKPSAVPGAATSVESIAPPDQYATGGHHEDQKKEMKKSVKKGEHEGHPDQSPGQHRTGSYTGTTGGQRQSGR